MNSKYQLRQNNYPFDENQIKLTARALARILNLPFIFKRVAIQNGPKWAKIL